MNKKIKRLIKKKIVAMDMSMFQNSINQVSQKGRTILKSLENFKFTLEQAARLLNNNQEVSQGMIQKRKQVDALSNKLYQIVFDIENIDISESFMNSQQPVLQNAPNNDPNKKNQQPNNPQGPSINGPQNGPQPSTPNITPSGTLPTGTPPVANPNTPQPNNGEEEE